LRLQVPYEYYSLPFCSPDQGVIMSAENLGEFLTGDRIDNSPYQLLMRDDTTCNVLCQKTLTQRDVEAFQNAIDEEYHHNWIVDNLPAAGISKAGESGALKTQYVKGFPIGYVAEDENIMGYSAAAAHIKPKHYLYNHMELIVQYHQVKEGFEGADSNRVVGFLVQPRSVKHMFASGESWSGKKDDFMPYLTTCEKYADDPLEAAAQWNKMEKEEEDKEKKENAYYGKYKCVAETLLLLHMSTTCVCERANNPPPSLPSFIHSFIHSFILSFFLSFFQTTRTTTGTTGRTGRGRAAAAPWARTSRATKWSRRPWSRATCCSPTT
jgi:hypothetical protein